VRNDEIQISKGGEKKGKHCFGEALPWCEAKKGEIRGKLDVWFFGLGISTLGQYRVLGHA